MPEELSEADEALAPLHPGVRVPLLWTALNSIAAAFSVAAFLVVLLPSVTVNRSWSYPAAEWLINLSTGYVRRGFGGSALAAVPGLSEKAALLGAVTGLLLVVVLLMWVLVASIMAVVQSAFPLLIWLVPGGPVLGLGQLLWQPFPDAAGLFVFRKEYLAYVVVLALACALTRHAQWAAARLTLLSVLVGSALFVVALIHEAVAVFGAVAALLMLWAVPARWAQRMRSGLLIGLPVALGVGIALLHATQPSGSAAAMWSNLQPGTREWLDNSMPNSMLFVEWDSAGLRALTQAQVYDSGNWSVWILLAAAGLAFSWLTVRVVDPRPETRRPVAGSFAVLVAGSVALSTLGGDVGRWISITCVLGIVVGFTWTGVRRPVSHSRASPVTIIALIGATAAILLLGLPEAGDPRGLPWGW